MKKTIIFSLMFCVVGTGIKAQQKVKDKAKASVLNNTEFMNLQRLQPESYHYWIWYKKIFGIKIPMPGLGLHDRYGKKDMRLVFQETPMVAAVAYNESQTEKYEEKVNTVFVQESAKFGDRMLDSQYYLTEDERRKLRNDIFMELAKFSVNGGDPAIVTKLSDEVIRIDANVKIMKGSFISASKKREAYIEFQKELMEVYKLAIKLNKINKVIK